MDMGSRINVGIIGAMESEVEHLVSCLTEAETKTILGMVFHEGLLDGVRVVVVRSGIGKVNAAVCAGVLSTCLGVTHIINTGVAGAIDERLQIGDMVISTDVMEHDMDVSGLGFEPGIIPWMDTSAFEADAQLRALTLRASREVVPELDPWEGRVVSGDQFVSDLATRNRLQAQFGALCCEMEGAAIGHVAHLAKLPFVVVRAVSDQANGASVEDYPAFERETASRCSHIVERLVSLIGLGEEA